MKMTPSCCDDDSINDSPTAESRAKTKKSQIKHLDQRAFLLLAGLAEKMHVSRHKKTSVRPQSLTPVFLN
jgi:hypothetical protein